MAIPAVVEDPVAQVAAVDNKLVEVEVVDLAVAAGEQKPEVEARSCRAVADQVAVDLEEEDDDDACGP